MFTLYCVSYQVSISEADLQAMGGTITMVTQEGTTITIPAHELATQGAHSVTMVTTDGSDEQVNNCPCCVVEYVLFFLYKGLVHFHSSCCTFNPVLCWTSLMTPDVVTNSFVTQHQSSWLIFVQCHLSPSGGHHDTRHGFVPNCGGGRLQPRPG